MATTSTNEAELTSRRRANIAEIRTNHWAVFRSLREQTSCRFTVIYPTKEEAVEQARSLAAESFAAGKTDFAYFVVKIEHEVGFSGKEIFDRGI